jgi:hypothetical protein
VAAKPTPDSAALAKAKAGVKTLEKKTAMLATALPGAAQLPAAPTACTAPVDGILSLPKRAAPATEKHLVVTVAKDDGRTNEQRIVDVTLAPSVNAALMVQDLTHRSNSLDLPALSWYFKNAGVVAAGGNLEQLQEMLAVQARALDLIFIDFARRAANAQTTERQDAFLKIAMKAQAQSRNTVESLAVIQHGPAIFAKQANVNRGGQQQVNNGVPAIASASPAAIPAPAAPATAPRVRERKQKAANQTIGRNHG